MTILMIDKLDTLDIDIVYDINMLQIVKLHDCHLSSDLQLYGAVRCH